MISLLWIGFIVFVLAMLAIDLFLVNRDPHEVRMKEALGWTGVCVALALLFNVAVYYIYEHDWLGIGSNFANLTAPGGPEHLVVPTGMGKRAATEFFTGWLIEYSLSMDNIFVIALIFAHFRIPAKYQHRVLFWGIMGALILRGVMILAGSVLVTRFEWVIYLFGLFLIYTGIKMVGQNSDDYDPEQGIVLRTARRLLPVTAGLDGERFTTRVDGRLMVTPLFIVLLIVESTDVVFAVDSIPAIFGITRDPFLVFTSNVFAIMGLRSLYFALASLMNKFTYLKYSLAFILVFVGVKMMLEGVHHVRPLVERWSGGLPSWLGWLPVEPVHLTPTVSLSIIAVALAAGVGVSLARPPKKVAARSATE
ncbi:MAG: membrane protein [Phycisphaerae bacterium]|nr:MAG: membrane protein [Phycisphaerae bacterium]